MFCDISLQYHFLGVVKFILSQLHNIHTFRRAAHLRVIIDIADMDKLEMNKGYRAWLKILTTTFRLPMAGYTKQFIRLKFGNTTAIFFLMTIQSALTAFYVFVAYNFIFRDAYAITKAFVVAFVMTFFSVFDVPVFWPILLCYWVVLFVLTMKRQIVHMIKYKYVPFSIGKQ
ncbi:hypothetical protein ACJX0J_015727, partial [Zea mays]